MGTKPCMGEGAALTCLRCSGRLFYDLFLTCGSQFKCFSFHGLLLSILWKWDLGALPHYLCICFLTLTVAFVFLKWIFFKPVFSLAEYKLRDFAFLDVLVFCILSLNLVFYPSAMWVLTHGMFYLFLFYSFLLPTAAKIYSLLTFSPSGTSKIFLKCPFQARF